MFKIAIQRGIGDITRRFKDKLNFVVKYKKVKLKLNWKEKNNDDLLIKNETIASIICPRVRRS